MITWPNEWERSSSQTIMSLPKISLLEKQVLIVALNLDTFTFSAEQVMALSQEERDRAERFYTPLLQQRYLVTHIFLRELLACQLQMPTKDLNFDYGSNGKPFCVNNARLEFNLSHSANMALFAVAFDIPVGIDIQEHREVAYQEIAARFLHEKNAQHLSQSIVPEPSQLFFDYWCCYEALLKANGEGIANLNKYLLEIDTGIPQLITAPASTLPSQWTLDLLKVPVGYSAAIAYPARDCHLMTRIYFSD